VVFSFVQRATSALAQMMVHRASSISAAEATPRPAAFQSLHHQRAAAMTAQRALSYCNQAGNGIVGIG
jgi:hypothetical protein